MAAKEWSLGAHCRVSVEALAVADTMPKLNDRKPNQGNIFVT